MTIETHLSVISNEDTKRMIAEKYSAFFSELATWKDTAESIVVTDVSEVELMKEAGKARKALVKVRTGADKVRKELKADSLNYSRAVQAIYQEIEDNIKPIEQHLKLQEDFKKLVEEKELAEKISNRNSTLLKNGIDPELYNIDLLTDDQFEHLLKTTLLAKEAELREKERAEKERIEAEKKQKEIEEIERIEKEAEERLIKEENEKLKIEAEKLREEQLRIAAERQKEREEVERKARIEREKIAVERLKEQQERNKLEAELREKQELEEKKELEEKLRVELLNRGSDSDKLKSLAEQFKHISYPELTSGYGKELLSRVKENVSRMILALETQK